MKSNAEIKQHKGLDLARYSEITRTKGLARERDVGHTLQIVKPASQPARRSSHNPPWMARGVRGRIQTGVDGEGLFTGEHLSVETSQAFVLTPLLSCTFYEMASRCHSLRFSWSLYGQLCSSWAFALWPAAQGDKSLRGQSDRPAAVEDYTIKLLVNPVARHKPKYPERCLEGCMLGFPW